VVGVSILDPISQVEVFAIPLVHRFRGITVRAGVLLRGPAGWAEFAPFDDYDDRACVPWLRAGIESATKPWPVPRRERVPVNAIIPVVGPDRAAAIAAASGCGTAKIKVAEPGIDLAADVARVAAVRAALGAAGRIRIDANAAWSSYDAAVAIEALRSAAGDLEYVEQPCRTLDEILAVRRATGVRVAADESIRLADDPFGVRLGDFVDVAVVKVPPLGGVRATLSLAAATGLPTVVSSALDSAVGLAAGVAAAAALPELSFACGLGTGALLAGDVSSESPRPVDGFLTAPRRPPEPDRIAEFRAPAAMRSAWLARLHRVAALADGAP
jgi:o-succinylbenzoate synthase